MKKKKKLNGLKKMMKQFLKLYNKKNKVKQQFNKIIYKIIIIKILNNKIINNNIIKITIINQIINNQNLL